MHACIHECMHLLSYCNLPILRFIFTSVFIWWMLNGNQRASQNKVRGSTAGDLQQLPGKKTSQWSGEETQREKEEKKWRDGDKKWWEWQTGQRELYNTGNTHGSETFKINHFEFDIKVRRRCTLMKRMWCQPARSSSLMVPWKPPSWAQKIGTDKDGWCDRLMHLVEETAVGWLDN